MTAGRRARLTISRIDPWTVFKFSIILYICIYLILMVAGVALWTAGTITGLRDNVESFVGDLISSPKFRFIGGQILSASAVGGAIMVLVGSGINVLMVVLYNLITDLVGGIGVTLDERPRTDQPRTDQPRTDQPRTDQRQPVKGKNERGGRAEAPKEAPAAPPKPEGSAVEAAK